MNQVRLEQANEEYEDPISWTGQQNSASIYENAQQRGEGRSRSTSDVYENHEPRANQAYEDIPDSGVRVHDETHLYTGLHQT